MREPISRDSASPRELAEATRRLDRALEQLEAAWASRASSSPAQDTSAPDAAAFAALECGRNQLAAELEAARAREGTLEAAAAAASQALGRAAAEVRAALGQDPSGDGQIGDGQIGDGEAGEDQPDKNNKDDGRADDGEAGQAATPEGGEFNEEAA